MKQALRLLARFLLISVLLVLVLGALVVLSRYVISYHPGQTSGETIVAQLLNAMREVFLVSVMMGAVAAVFATMRTSHRPFLPLLVLSVFWTAVLVVGALLWPSTRVAQPSIAAVPEERVVQISGAYVYSPNVEGTQVFPVAIYRPERRPGLELYPQALIDRDDVRLTIPANPEIELSLTEVEASYPAMVAVPERLEPLLRDVAALNRLVMRPDSEASAEATVQTSPARNQRLLLVLALGVLLLACWTPARLTRWPLFNAFVVFLCLRGALWLINAVHFGELGRLLATAVRSDQLGLVSSGALLFVALVFMVALFLMRPVSEWKREVGDG